MKEIMFGHPVRRDLFGRDQVAWDEVFTVPPHSHFVTVGGSGAGKGSTVIIPNLLRYTGQDSPQARASVIVVDPKGENARTTANARRRMGYQVVILDPWQEVNRQYVDRYPERRLRREIITPYNPLLRLDPRDRHFYEGLVDFGSAVVERPEVAHDPHWPSTAEELTMGVSADAIERGAPSLAQVYRDIRLDPESFAQLAEAAIQRGGHAGDLIRPFIDASGDNREMRSIFSAARTQLRFLGDPILAADLSVPRNSFEFAELTQRPITLYLVMPPDKFGTEYRRWLRLMLTQAIRAVMRVRPHDKVLVMIDEFGTLGALPIVADSYGLARSLGLTFHIFVQDLNQLAALYGQKWQSFLANAGAIQFFRTGDQFTMNYVAQEIGQYLRRTSHVSISAQGQSVSFGEQWDQRMRPEDIKRDLQQFSYVFAPRGDGTSEWHRLKPMPYYATRAFAGQYDPLPEFEHAPSPGWFGPRSR